MSRKPAYSKECRNLLKLLVEEEGCTTAMIINLTGIPHGSVVRLVAEEKAVWKSKFPGGRLGTIVRARTLATLKTKYAKQLATLFPRSPV